MSEQTQQADPVNLDPVSQSGNVQQNVVDQAVAKYPILKQANPVGLMSIGKEQDNMLENWNVGNMGTATRPRPQELPPDRTGIEVFSSKTTPDDVAGDIVSHTLVNTDPKLSVLYDQFKGSLTGNQKDFLYGDYLEEKSNVAKHGGDDPGEFSEWLDRVGAPAALRGKVFNQYSKHAQEQFGYTRMQKHLLDQIKQHVTQPQ